jgi:heme a synthase
VLVNYRIRVVDKVRVGAGQGWRLRPAAGLSITHYMRSDSWRRF